MKPNQKDDATPDFAAQFRSAYEETLSLTEFTLLLARYKRVGYEQAYQSSQPATGFWSFGQENS